VCFALPNTSVAQTSSPPVTRAQVHAQLVQLEKAGYKPSKTHYPDDILAAEKRVANEEEHAPAQIGVNGVAGNMVLSQ
jgi:uncharacterized protein DUF4148